MKAGFLGWRGRSAFVRFLGAVACFVSAGAVQTLAAPITFNSALPVAQGEFVVREQFVLEQSGHDPSAADRDRTAWSVISVLGYGVTAKLDFFAVVPYVDRDLELTAGGQDHQRESNGLGDIRLFARFGTYKKDWPGRTLRLAVVGGLELPTGDHDDSDSLGRLPLGVQAGSGTWDPFSALVLSYQSLEIQADVQFRYQANTVRGGFGFGDQARIDLSGQYRLWPRELGSGVPGFLYGVLETNAVYQGQNRVAGADDPNSGGYRLFLVPGVQFVTRRWIAEAAVQVPVYQDLNGTALESGYVVRAGMRFNF